MNNTLEVFALTAGYLCPDCGYLMQVEHEPQLLKRGEAVAKCVTVNCWRTGVRVRIGLTKIDGEILPADSRTNPHGPQEKHEGKLAQR